MAELDIVILSYNVSKLLKQCLESVLASPESDKWQIIVVDNASQDDSVEMVRREFPQVKLITSEQNLGFSAGNNLAVPYLKSEFVLFLNPDTVVKPKAIETVRQYLKSHPQVGAATARVWLGNSGKIDEGCHRGFPTPWNAVCYFSGLSKWLGKYRLFGGYQLSFQDLDTAHPIDSLTGAFMMVRRDVAEQLNWWDEDYFWNGEDVDFCYRIKQAGYQIMYLPEAEIIHFKGSSAGYKPDSFGRQQASKEIKQSAAKASTQAMKIFYRKHYQKKYPSWLTGLVLAGIWLLERYRLWRAKQ